MQFALQQSELPGPKATDIDGWRKELDGYYEVMMNFTRMDIGEVMLRIASFSSRASYIRSQIVRSTTRASASFRTQEIDPFIQETERQFKVFSRLQSVFAQEWEMSSH